MRFNHSRMIFRSEQKTFFISADCVPIFCAPWKKHLKAKPEYAFANYFFFFSKRATFAVKNGWQYVTLLLPHIRTSLHSRLHTKFICRTN